MQLDSDFHADSDGKNVVWIVAFGGFVAGVLIWAVGLLTLASLVADNLPNIEAGSVAWNCETDPDTLSLDQVSLYNETCPEPTPEPTLVPTATPEPVSNRLDCGQIRGTDYLSTEERTWFLDNCVRR
jgi:hypothetical protein